MVKRLELPQELKNRVHIKNVKDGFGHDLMGMYCDIFLDKKNVGYHNDDGWGGEPELSLTDEAKQKILSLLESHQWRSRMFMELGWDFYETEDRIDDQSVIQSLIEHLYDEKQKEKMMKKIAKKADKEIVYGRWDNFQSVGFKGSPTLRQLVTAHGVTKIQAFIDTNIKSKLKEGEQILNPNFEELGLIR